MHMEETEVLIVGGGPTGMVAALLLARRGVSSILLERNAGTNPHPRAHELNGRSAEILLGLGVAMDEISARSAPDSDVEQVLFCRTINEAIAGIGAEGAEDRRASYALHLRPGANYFNISQSELESVLLAEVRRQPCISYRAGHTWVAMRQAQESVTSTIKSISGKAEFSIKSQYLLGCDGASSTCRKAANIPMDGPPEIQQFINAHLEMDLRHHVRIPAKLYWIMTPGSAGVFAAHHIERRWVYSMPLQAPFESPADYSDPDLRHRIGRALGLPAEAVSIRGISTWRMSAQIARRYREERLFLLGDAAHRFPPTGGLGMNTGIADAHNLCWKLVEVLRGRADDALLDTYEIERQPVARANCEQSVANYWRIHDVIKAVGLHPVGLRAIAAILWLPPMRWLPRPIKRTLRGWLEYPGEWLARRALHSDRLRARIQREADAQLNHFYRLGLDLGYTYETGAIVPDGTAPPDNSDPVAIYCPSLRPGSRLPHFWLQGNDGRISSHDLIPPTGFSLLCGSATHLEAMRLESDLIRVHPIGTGCGLDDLNGEWSALCNGSGNMAVMVRPDGHIALRTCGERNEVLRAIRKYIDQYWHPSHPGEKVANQEELSTCAW